MGGTGGHWWHCWALHCWVPICPLTIDGYRHVKKVQLITGNCIYLVICC
ncbi:unnamed protein product, partial [Staurois parvus]